MNPSQAQGTIEYLVILGAIVTISIIIVGIVSGAIFSPTQQIIKNTSPIGGLTRGGIVILDTIVSAEGNGLINLQNNTGEGLIVTKLSLDGADNNYYYFLPSEEFW